MPKACCVLLLCFCLLVSSVVKSQVPFSIWKNDSVVFKDPKVKVTINLLADTFKTTDSIKVLVTIINQSNKVQKVLFGKQGGGRPWGMAALVVNQDGKSVTALQNRSMMESQIYSESDLEKKGYYYNLQPNEKDTWVYYLNRILVFNFDQYNQLEPGTYYFDLSYFGNQSNKVAFTIKK